jgi:hypothetical protein
LGCTSTSAASTAMQVTSRLVGYCQLRVQTVLWTSGCCPVFNTEAPYFPPLTSSPPLVSTALLACPLPSARLLPATCLHRSLSLSLSLSACPLSVWTCPHGGTQSMGPLPTRTLNQSDKKRPRPRHLGLEPALGKAVSPSKSNWTMLVSTHSTLKKKNLPRSLRNCRKIRRL